MVEFIKEHAENEYFWEVKNENGEIGYVPSTHVLVKEQHVRLYGIDDDGTCTCSVTFVAQMEISVWARLYFKYHIFIKKFIKYSMFSSTGLWIGGVVE